jgi:ribosome-associated toxin RatA of RatAB toxin-antitoxin module
MAPFAEQSAFRISSPLETGLAIESLMPLLAKGELSLVESAPDGSLAQVTCMALVNSPPGRTFETITDFQNYSRFVPHVIESKIVDRNAEFTDVRFEIDLPLSSIKYVMRYRYNGITSIDIHVAGGDIKTGVYRWDICPVGNRTVAMYSLHTKVGESSWFLRKILKSQPGLEHTINLATGNVLVKAIKRESERRSGWQG